MVNEKTLVLVKPDGVTRKLTGEIISRVERTGLKVVGLKMTSPNEDVMDSHYALSDDWTKSLMEKSKSSAEKEGREFAFSDQKET